MKKWISILLAAGMLVLCFAGCSGGSRGDKVTILYPGEESERMTELMAGELGEQIKKDTGLTVELVYVPWEQYWEQKDIMLAAKEPIDLYWDGLPDISTMVNKKQCEPLDDLLEQYGQDILKVIPKEYIRGGTVNGTLYGIPSSYAPSSAMYQLVCLRQDLLEDVGMSDVKTADDLMRFSTLVKEKYPEIRGGADHLYKPLTRYFGEEQYFWIASQDLVVFGQETGKAYSYFETEAFQEVAKFNRKMMLAGQYHDDITTKVNESAGRMQSGLYIWTEGSLGRDHEIIDTVRQNAPEADLKCYLLAPEKPKYINVAGGEVMCIPTTAPNKAGAMKFLNWIYQSEDHYNLAIYGVEGVDYELIDGRIKRIMSDDLFYEWMFRNQNYQRFPQESTQEEIDTYRTWDDDALMSKAFGFRFNNENVLAIENKCNEITGKMFTQICTGFVDFETEYPKAVAALKEAGIDEYVAEVQRQLDEFFAQQKS